MGIQGTLKKQYQALENKANGFSARERIIMFLMLNAFSFMGVYTFIIEPVFESVRSMSKEITSTKNELLVADGDFQVIKIEYSIDPNEHINKKIDVLVEKIKRSNALLRSKTSELISSSAMVQVLKQLLMKQKDVHLVSLNNTEVVPVVWEEPEGEGGVPEKKSGEIKGIHDAIMESVMTKMIDVGALGLPSSSPAENVFLAKEILLYRHGVRMVLEADYRAFVKYLLEIESMNWNFLWHSVNYQVIEHPKARVELEIHTLGFEEGWLGV